MADRAPTAIVLALLIAWLSLMAGAVHEDYQEGRVQRACLRAGNSATECGVPRG